MHRRLQSRAQAKTLPEPLSLGYVFLADAEMQTGLDIAGQRINAIQTEYAKASAATVVLRLGEGESGVSKVDESGQISFFGLESDAELAVEAADEQGHLTGESQPVQPRSFDFEAFFSMGASRGGEGVPDLSRATQVAGSVALHRYALNAGVPKRFKTQMVCVENEVTEEDCAQRFMISTRDLFEAMKSKVPVEKRTIEVFTHAIQQEFNFAADLSPAQAAEAAQKALLRNKTFDPRELRRALLRKVEIVMREETMGEADDPEKVGYFLDVILATHPELLHEAQKAALAQYADIQDAADLPAEISWSEPLSISPRNVYGVLPAGLNSWEKQFAELLDRDANKVVTWWHRNEPRQPCR